MHWGCYDATASVCLLLQYLLPITKLFAQCGQGFVGQLRAFSLCDQTVHMAGTVATFETSDGHTLSYETWRSATQASGGTPITVVFLHGVHESADTLVILQTRTLSCLLCVPLPDGCFVHT